MTVVFSPKALKRLKRLDHNMHERIVDFMANISHLDDPRSRGKALTANFAGLWRYRVGKYRLVCKIVDSELVILVVDVAHRKEIYDK